MATAFITVDSKEVKEKLGLIEDFPKILKEPTQTLLSRLLDRMQTYPPPPAGSTYVRTFNLKNSWRTELLLSGQTLGRTISSGIDYNIYVQDQDNQAAVHQGRWDTAQAVAKEEEKEAAAIFDDFLQELLR